MKKAIFAIVAGLLATQMAFAQYGPVQCQRVFVGYNQAPATGGWVVVCR